MTDPVATAERELPVPLAQAIEQFDKWCRAAPSEQEAKDRIEKPLYHYTNAAGLMGIFDSQRLWLTDYRHLNDPKELHHGVAIAHDVLRVAVEGADRRVGLFLRDVIDLFSKENLENLVSSSRASAVPAMISGSGAPMPTMGEVLRSATLLACSRFAQR